MYICSFYQKQNCACNTNNTSIPSFGSSFLLGQLLKAINDQDKSFFDQEYGNNGNTVLHYLAGMNNTSAIRRIEELKFLNDILNRKNGIGKTPLDVAINDNVKEILISLGAKTSSQIDTESSKKEINLGKQPVDVGLIIHNPQKDKKSSDLPEGNEAENSSPVSVEQSTTAKDKKSGFGKFRFEKASNESDEKTVVKKEASSAENEKQIKHSSYSEFHKFEPHGLEKFLTLKTIVGISDDVKKSLTDIITTIRKHDSSLKIPNGILITSKNGDAINLAKVLKNETNIPVLEYTNIQELEKMLKEINDDYKKTQEPTVLLIRDIDLHLRNTPVLRSTLKRLLPNCADKGILVLATTNNAGDIPCDITVPEILDTIYRIDEPDRNARKNFITYYLEKENNIPVLNKEENLNKVVDLTSGFSLAQLRHVLTACVRTKAATSKDTINMEDLENAIKQYSKEQNIPEINEYNKTSMYDTALKRTQYAANDPRNLSDVGGMKEVKEKIYNKIIKRWKNEKVLRSNHLSMPDGILLYGSPGNGKTFIAKAIAGELSYPLYVLKMSDVGTSYVHETSKKIKEIIDQLKNKYEKTGEPSVLFLDEFDSLGGEKGNGTSRTEEVNTLLQEFDNAGNKGIILIAATNHNENLEEALIRDGRIGEKIYVGNPDKDAKLEIISKFLQKTPELQEILQDSSYLEELATQCEEMSSASLVKILNEASYEFLVNNVPFKTAANNAIESYNEKEINDILAKKHICSKKRLELNKDSTIKYDTNFLRYIYDDNDVKDFTGIGGRKKVKDALQRMLIRMWKPEVIARMKANHMAMPSGIILYGTSGNGKTTIVKALAGEMKLPLYEMKMGDVGSSYIHQTSNLIGEMFDQLTYKYKKTKEPSILFIDELESIAPRREALTANSQYKQEEITELLRRMNTASENGIILVGATNFIDAEYDENGKLVWEANHDNNGNSESVRYHAGTTYIEEYSKSFEYGEKIIKYEENSDGTPSSYTVSVPNEEYEKYVQANGYYLTDPDAPPAMITVESISLDGDDYFTKYSTHEEFTSEYYSRGDETWSFDALGNVIGYDNSNAYIHIQKRNGQWMKQNSVGAFVIPADAPPPELPKITTPTVSVNPSIGKPEFDEIDMLGASKVKLPKIPNTTTYSDKGINVGTSTTDCKVNKNSKEINLITDLTNLAQLKRAREVGDITQGLSDGGVEVETYPVTYLDGKQELLYADPATWTPKQRLAKAKEILEELIARGELMPPKDGKIDQNGNITGSPCSYKAANSSTTMIWYIAMPDGTVQLIEGKEIKDKDGKLIKTEAVKNPDGSYKKATNVPSAVVSNLLSNYCNIDTNSNTLDGKKGSFSQGMGDCGFLSTINGFSSAELNDMIRPKPSENPDAKEYTVTFNGILNTFGNHIITPETTKYQNLVKDGKFTITVTKEELDDLYYHHTLPNGMDGVSMPSKLVSGDKDMKLVEIATLKLWQDLQYEWLDEHKSEFVPKKYFKPQKDNNGNEIKINGETQYDEIQINTIEEFLKEIGTTELYTYPKKIRVRNTWIVDNGMGDLSSEVYNLLHSNQKTPVNLFSQTQDQNEILKLKQSKVVKQMRITGGLIGSIVGIPGALIYKKQLTDAKNKNPNIISVFSPEDFQLVDADINKISIEKSVEGLKKMLPSLIGRKCGTINAESTKSYISELKLTQTEQGRTDGSGHANYMIVKANGSNDYQHLANSHAYKIVGYDDKNENILIVNPWRSDTILNIPYETFVTTFTVESPEWDKYFQKLMDDLTPGYSYSDMIKMMFG